MPIRTNRGRAAVYRRLWGWPLRSPMHLLTSGLIVAIVAVVIAFALPDAPQVRESAQRDTRYPATLSSTRNEATRTTEPEPVPRLSGPSEPPSSVPPSDAALRVAENWARAWVKHPDGISNKKWLDGLRPYTTDEYLPVMSSVNPANVPASKVTGDAEATRSYPRSTEVTVPTDGGDLELTLIKTPQGWRVTGYTGGD